MILKALAAGSVVVVVVVGKDGVEDVQKGVVGLLSPEWAATPDTNVVRFINEGRTAAVRNIVM